MLGVLFLVTDIYMFKVDKHEVLSNAIISAVEFQIDFFRRRRVGRHTTYTLTSTQQMEPVGLVIKTRILGYNFSNCFKKYVSSTDDLALMKRKVPFGR